MEVDLDDTRTTNRELEVIGRDGDLQFHLPTATPTLRYMAGSQTLISSSGMRNGSSARNPTTSANADTRLTTKEFYAPRHNRLLAIREMGGAGWVVGGRIV